MFSTFIHRLRTESEEGATATEYALLVALIAMVIMAGISLYGGSLKPIYQNAVDAAESWIP